MSFSVLPDSHYEFSSQYLWQKGSSINFLRCIFTLFCFVFLKIMRKYSVSTWIPRIDIEMLPALLLPFQSLINFAGFYPKKTPTTSVALFRNIFLVEFTGGGDGLFTHHVLALTSASVCQDDLVHLGMHRTTPKHWECTETSACLSVFPGKKCWQGKGRKFLANSVTNFSPVCRCCAFQHLPSFPPCLSSCFCDS